VAQEAGRDFTTLQNQDFEDSQRSDEEGFQGWVSCRVRMAQQ
jgi:hypothetical protein